MRSTSSSRALRMSTGTGGDGRRQLSAHVEAVELAGQADVDDHQARGLAPDGGQAALGVVGLHHPEAVPAQVHGDQVADVVVVLDHHHADSRRSPSDQPATAVASRRRHR